MQLVAVVVVFVGLLAAEHVAAELAVEPHRYVIDGCCSHNNNDNSHSYTDNNSNSDGRSPEPAGDAARAPSDRRPRPLGVVVGVVELVCWAESGELVAAAVARRLGRQRRRLVL